MPIESPAAPPRPRRPARETIAAIPWLVVLAIDLAAVLVLVGANLAPGGPWRMRDEGIHLTGMVLGVVEEQPSDDEGEPTFWTTVRVGERDRTYVVAMGSRHPLESEVSIVVDPVYDGWAESEGHAAVALFWFEIAMIATAAFPIVVRLAKWDARRQRERTAPDSRSTAISSAV